MGPSGALALRLRALIVALGIPPFVPSPTQPSATMRPRSVTGLVAGRFKIHSPEGKFHGSIRPLAINSPRGQAARQHRVRHDGRRHAPHHPTCRRHPAHLAGMQAGTGELGLFCALRLPPESRRRPDRLEQALRETVEAHPALRSVVREVDGKPYQVIRETPAQILQRSDSWEWAITKPFDVENGPLFRL